jgi:hypothetical protein
MALSAIQKEFCNSDDFELRLHMLVRMEVTG